MKIALFGGTGRIGKRIAAEALDRGHDVLAVVRNPATARLDDRVEYTAGDATHAPTVAKVVAGADVVVSAVGPRKAEPAVLVKAARNLLEGVAAAGVARLVVVGGSGTLQGAGGVALMDAPDADPEGRPLAEAHAEVLALLRAAPAGLEWTYVSPPPVVEDGERTGTYRTGGDEVLVDDEGDSHITVADLAVAVVDEVERAAFAGRRMTVAY
jgi:putative NADH-flavin reductase